LRRACRTPIVAAKSSNNNNNHAPQQPFRRTSKNSTVGRQPLPKPDAPPVHYIQTGALFDITPLLPNYNGSARFILVERCNPKWRYFEKIVDLDFQVHCQQLLDPTYLRDMFDSVTALIIVLSPELAEGRRLGRMEIQHTFGFLLLEDMPDGNEDLMRVEAICSGARHGRQLMTITHHLAKILGRKKMMLQSLDEPVPFYEHLGYKKDRHEIKTMTEEDLRMDGWPMVFPLRSWKLSVGRAEGMKIISGK